MNISISAFELLVGAIAGLIIMAVWLVSRRRGGSRDTPVPSELISLAAIGLAALLLYAYRWQTKDPLLFLGAASVLILLGTSGANLVVSNRLRRDFTEVSSRFTQQMAGLGNLHFFPTKDATIEALTAETMAAKEKLIATRFSPADIALESDYWAAIKRRAFDPSVLSIRIHSLAHTDESALVGACRLVEELRGAQRFQLAIAMFNNSFEIIVADELECIFCFNDLSMTIRNGFRLDSSQPNSERLIDNFEDTLRRMLGDCHVIIDFETFVQSQSDVRAVQSFLKKLHTDYREGRLPKPVHANEMVSYLRGKLASGSPAATDVSGQD